MIIKPKNQLQRIFKEGIMAEAKKIDENVGTGRRKSAVASVRLRPGGGKVEVNGREFEKYFTLQTQRSLIFLPLDTVQLGGKFDLLIRVKGGGVQAQAEAVRLGIARALVDRNEDLREPLKEKGLLTRDPRKKERKKYGQPGARKKFQFSKR